MILILSTATTAIRNRTALPILKQGISAAMRQL